MDWASMFGGAAGQSPAQGGTGIGGSGKGASGAATLFGDGGSITRGGGTTQLWMIVALVALAAVGWFLVKKGK